MAIYYVDIYNGYERPINALALASQMPGTTNVIITYGNCDHGLTTGEQVVLTGFTAYLNGTWTITVVNARSFTLNGVVWTTTADYNGNCSPVVTTGGNDGSSWANAFKNIGSSQIQTGIYNVALQPGDIVKVAKTPDPISIGNATWENRTKAIVLAAPLTQLIEAGIGNTWTAVAPTTLGTSTIRKKGANCQQINIAATTGTGKIAYKTLAATLNLSAFQNISLFFGSSDQIKFNASGFKLCLCSDAIGNTIVDSFYLDWLMNTATFNIQTYKKGAALGNTINSIAIYRDGSPVSFNIRLQCIIACNTLALDSLIGKSNALDTAWYPIKYIDGVNVELDSATIVDYTGYYYGTNETVETFIRETFNISIIPLNSKFISFNAAIAGTEENSIVFSGGWNIATNEQDGETWFDNIANTNSGLFIYQNAAYLELTKLNFVRFEDGIETYIESFTTTQPNYTNIHNMSCVGNIYGASFGFGTVVDTIKCLHNRENGMTLHEYNHVTNFLITGNGGTGAYAKAGLYLLKGCNHISSGILMWNARSLVIDSANNILRDFIFSIPQNYFPVVENGSNNKFINIDAYSETTGTLGTAAHLSGFNELVNCKIGMENSYSSGAPVPGQGIIKFTDYWGHAGRTGMVWGGSIAILEFKPDLSFGDTLGIWLLTLNYVGVKRNKIANIYCPVIPIAVKAGVSTTVGLNINRTNNASGSALICRRDMSTAIDADIISPLPLANGVWVLAEINIVPERDGVVLVEIHGYDSIASVTGIYFSTIIIT